MCVSVVSEAAPAEVAAAPPGARLWFQIYCLRDRGLTADLLGQAADAGFEAIVLAVDSPVIGRRDRSVRSGWRFPERFLVRSVGASGARAPISAADLAALLDSSVTWDDLAWIASSSGLPLILKGVMTAEDTRLASEHGVAAVIVSNHGGRQLDDAPATLAALAEVVAAAGDGLETLIDGGVRRGRDVLVALALGARAVLIGRPAMWGLAAAGAEGVEDVLRLLGDELDSALALCGCTAPADARPSLVGGLK
jgi:4-hydroxymandelate oxidase